MKNQNYNSKGWDKQFDNILDNVKHITDQVNDYLLAYFKRSFDTKSFDNKKWKPSKNNKNTLVDSGDLKRSIKTVSKTVSEIHIQSNTPYSAIHNYGGKIKITDKMRKYFWSQYYKTKNNDWKYMAISKQKYINIPQRQFMGETQEMMNEIEQIIIDVLKS